MSKSRPGFFVRIFLAPGVYFRYLFSGDFAAAVVGLEKKESAKGIEETKEQAAEPAKVVETAPLKEASPDSALQLLGLLQQEGRFIDFIEEDVNQYSDADIGAAVRVVHEGCRKALHDHINTVSIREEAEGSRVTLPEGFDASSIRLSGNVVGQAPFTGTLIHRGWQVKEIKLPKLAEGHNVSVLAPAEVEL